MKPYVTIVVPFWNAATTLSRCIDSVLNQTRDDWELILVDDGSVDDGCKVCARYVEKDDRIRLLCRDHEGVGAARNAAMDEAQGKFLCFVDADDFVEPDYLEELCSCPDADLVVCGYMVDEYDSKGQLLSSTNHIEQDLTVVDFENRVQLETAFANGIMHINCNKLYKVDIIRKHNVKYGNYSVNEDFIFVVGYLKYALNIRFVSHALYHWVRVQGMVTGVSSIPENLLQIYELSHRMLSDYLDNAQVASRIAYQSYGMLIYKYMNQLMRGLIAKQYCFEGLKSLHQSPWVRQAFWAYTPHSMGERFFYWLYRMGWFRLSYMIYKRVL